MKSREKMDKKQSPGGSRSSATSGKGIGMATAGHAPQPSRSSHTDKKVPMSDEMRYRAEADMGALHRAHQIVTDKPRHAAVKQHAAELFEAAHAAGVSKSTNARGNTAGFKGVLGPSQSVSRKKR